MVNKETVLEKNLRKYEQMENENFHYLNLETDEQIVHCIDDSDERFYKTGWLVTNKGRVWSINHNKWLVPHIQEGYWRVENVYVHLLVNHYFLSEDDRRTIKVVEEHNASCAESDKWHIEVHHIKSVNKLDSSSMSDDEKILACMAVNNKANLICQIKETDHIDVHRIMNGKKTLGAEKGLETYDAPTSMFLNSGVSEASVTYNEDGNRVYNLTLRLKSTTPEEDEELDKIVPHPFLY